MDGAWKDPSCHAALLKRWGSQSVRRKVLVGWAHLDGLSGRLVNNRAGAKGRAEGHRDAVRTVAGVTAKPTAARDLDANLSVRLHHFCRRVLVA